MQSNLNLFKFKNYSTRKRNLTGVSLAIFLTACVSGPSFSQDLTPSNSFYYDGKTKVFLEVEDGMLAEFGNPVQPNDNGSRSAVKSSDSSASLVKTHGNLNLWRTNAKSGSVAVAKSLNSNSKIGYSPVFRTGKSGPLLALPGNILMEFEESMSESKIETFLLGKGLRIKKKLDIPGRNFYEIETPAGVASLNLANSLYGQPGVISSSPNWWREAVAK